MLRRHAHSAKDRVKNRVKAHAGENIHQTKAKAVQLVNSVAPTLTRGGNTQAHDDHANESSLWLPEAPNHIPELNTSVAKLLDTTDLYMDVQDAHVGVPAQPLEVDVGRILPLDLQSINPSNSPFQPKAPRPISQPQFFGQQPYEGVYPEPASEPVAPPMPVCSAKPYPGSGETKEPSNKARVPVDQPNQDAHKDAPKQEDDKNPGSAPPQHLPQAPQDPNNAPPKEVPAAPEVPTHPDDPNVPPQPEVPQPPDNDNCPTIFPPTWNHGKRLQKAVDNTRNKAHNVVHEVMGHDLFKDIRDRVSPGKGSEPGKGAAPVDSKPAPTLPTHGGDKAIAPGIPEVLSPSVPQVPGIPKAPEAQLLSVPGEPEAPEVPAPKLPGLPSLPKLPSLPGGAAPTQRLHKAYNDAKTKVHTIAKNVPGRDLFCEDDGSVQPPQVPGHHVTAPTLPTVPGLPGGNKAVLPGQPQPDGPDGSRTQRLHKVLSEAKNKVQTISKNVPGRGVFCEPESQQPGQQQPDEKPGEKPDAPEPKLPEPKLPDSKLPEPKLPEPKLPEPKLPDPKLPEPKLPQPGQPGDKPCDSKPGPLPQPQPLPKLPGAGDTKPGQPDPKDPKPEIPKPEVPKPKVPKQPDQQPPKQPDQKIDPQPDPTPGKPLPAVPSVPGFPSIPGFGQPNQDPKHDSKISTEPTKAGQPAQLYNKMGPMISHYESENKAAYHPSPPPAVASGSGVAKARKFKLGHEPCNFWGHME